ncbi:MAG: tail completion protein gp17 [Chloroflexota bacterium]
MEILAIDNLIHDRLAANATIAAAVSDRIYADMAPDSAALPYITYKKGTPAYTVGLGGKRALVRVPYTVILSVPGESYSAYDSVSDAIIQTLTGNFGSIGGVCVAPLAYAEFFDATHYRHLGGQFDFFASPTV